VRQRRGGVFFAAGGRIANGSNVYEGHPFGGILLAAGWTIAVP
jgi:hypothetical protein